MAGSVIVVGVDGSEGSRAALRWALAEARARGDALEVVHVWWAYPLVAPESELVKGDLASLQRRAGDFLRDFVEATIGAPRDVEVRTVTEQGSAAGCLIGAARAAELLVLGAHAERRLSAPLGSVSAQCLHHAPCPVVVVRGER